MLFNAILFSGLMIHRLDPESEPSLQELERLPPLYSQENVPIRDQVLHMHFFLGGCDWYGAEYDRNSRDFFGFAILNNDIQNAEWGYTNFDELHRISLRGIEVDRDLHWSSRKACEVDRIREARRI